MTLQIGSIVRPRVGPHKNEEHEIVHIFEDGQVNIRPLIGESLYKSGVVTCDPSLLFDAVNLTEEYEEPTGYWFSSMKETAKQRYRSNHPEGQTFGHAPGSSKYHKEKSLAHQRYADFHKNRYDHHDNLHAEEHAKRKPDWKVADHHRMSKDGHAEEFHNHTMASAHHHSLSQGGRPSYNKWVPRHNHGEASPVNSSGY